MHGELEASDGWWSRRELGDDEEGVALGRGRLVARRRPHKRSRMNARKSEGSRTAKPIVGRSWRSATKPSAAKNERGVPLPLLVPLPLSPRFSLARLGACARHSPSAREGNEDRELASPDFKN